MVQISGHYQMPLITIVKAIAKDTKCKEFRHNLREHLPMLTGALTKNPELSLECAEWRVDTVIQSRCRISYRSLSVPEGAPRRLARHGGRTVALGRRVFCETEPWVNG